MLRATSSSAILTRPSQSHTATTVAFRPLSGEVVVHYRTVILGVGLPISVGRSIRVATATRQRGALTSLQDTAFITPLVGAICRVQPLAVSRYAQVRPTVSASQVMRLPTCCGRGRVAGQSRRAFSIIC